MTEIIEIPDPQLTQPEVDKSILEIADGLLFEARREISEQKTLSIPIAELATLGAGVSSLIPALRTVTQTTIINTSGLYRVANKAATDTLKVAKNGNLWGWLKKADGTSKAVQLQPAEPFCNNAVCSCN